MNQKVKNLIQKLGEAIHESVSESEHIAGVVKNIREQGFDVTPWEYPMRVIPNASQRPQGLVEGAQNGSRRCH